MADDWWDLFKFVTILVCFVIVAAGIGELRNEHQLILEQMQSAASSGQGAD